VVDWFAERPTTTLFLSVLTVGELRKGIQTVTEKKRKMALLDWLETDLPNFFAGRILPIDTHVADRWGRLVAGAGCPLPAIDSLIGATAAHHGLSLVTRNVKDFADFELDVINPFNPF
jgi:predicted nucleic acid-binding protein